MTKPDKLYQQLLESSARSISFRDFERLLRVFGFVHKRTKGSHRQYVHSDVKAVMTVNSSGKEAHRYQVELLLELVEEYGLHLDR